MSYDSQISSFLEMIFVPHFAQSAPSKGVNVYGWERSCLGPIALLCALWLSVLITERVKERTGIFKFARGPLALSIWRFIYLYVTGGCLYQLSSTFGVVARPAELSTNFCVAASYLLCYVWMVLLQKDKERRVPTVIISVAAACTIMTAVINERAWRHWKDDPTYVVMVGGPLAVFGGWMLVVAVRSCSDLSRSVLPKVASDVSGLSSSKYTNVLERWTPLGNSVIIAITATLLPDPVLPVVPALAILLMHMQNRLAHAVLVVGSIVAFALATNN